MSQFDLTRFNDANDTFRFQLPVRAGFCLVDAIEQRPPATVVSTWTVPSEAPYLRGVVGGPWIVPGTVLSEMAVQAGELLVAAHRGPTTADEGIPVLTRVKRAAFKRVVSPGDVLECEVVLEGEAGPAFYVSARVTCGQHTVARLDLAFAATQAVAELQV